MVYISMVYGIAWVILICKVILLTLHTALHLTTMSAYIVILYSSFRLSKIFDKPKSTSYTHS